MRVKLGGTPKQLRDLVLDVFQFIQAQTGVRDDEDIAGRAVLIY